MGQRITLYHSDDLPADPRWRYIERLARSDRRSLGLRFGEPCDPRDLLDLYDVRAIVETQVQWDARCDQAVTSAFEGMGWSGLLLRVGGGQHLMLINPLHSLTRRNLTIGHEFGHLALGHEPVVVHSQQGMGENRYSDEQELEAFVYSLAILLPYAPLCQMLAQHASLRAIAHHYSVSVEAVEMRLKLLGLWRTRRHRLAS